MMKINLNSKGFAPIVIALAIVALAIVAGGAVYSYHKNHKAKAPVSSSTSTSAVVNTTKSSTPATSYFTIKEWGVQAPYSGSDLSYSAASDGSSMMMLESQAVDATIPASDTSASCKVGNAGSIGRYLPTDDIPGPKQQTAQAYLSQDFAATDSIPPTYAKVGSHYYIYWSPTASCSTDTAPINQATTAAESIVSHLVAVQ